MSTIHVQSLTKQSKPLSPLQPAKRQAEVSSHGPAIGKSPKPPHRLPQSLTKSHSTFVPFVMSAAPKLPQTHQALMIQQFHWTFPPPALDREETVLLLTLPRVFLSRLSGRCKLGGVKLVLLALSPPLDRVPKSMVTSAQNHRV